MLRAIEAGLRRLLSRASVDRDLDDEIQQYIAHATEAHIRSGLPRSEAERKARTEFGGVENVKEQLRSSGWDAVVTTIGQDLRFSVRMLRRHLAFTVVTLATIVVGIGANTAMFTIIRAVMLRPLPYAKPEALVVLWSDDVARGLHESQTAYQTVMDWKTSSRSVIDLAIFSGTTATTLDEPRERISATFVSPNIFEILGVRPALGRVITQREQDDHVASAVLSYAFWQRRFAGDSSVIGKTIRLDDPGKGGLPSLTVVGVMPERFAFPDKQSQFWVPASLYWRWEREKSERFPWWVRRWNVVGRLAHGVTVRDAQREFRVIGARLAREYPTTVSDFPGFVPRVVGLLDQVTGPTLQSTLWLLFGAVGLVLLIACTNVANLLLARGAMRRHELATRRALGASRVRLVGQMLMESLVVSVLGGVVAIAVATAATRALGLLTIASFPRFDEIRVDGSVVVFALVVSIVTGLAFGALPALNVTRVSPSAVLKDGSAAGGNSRQRRASGLFVMAQCSLAVVLLVGAGLLVRSLARINAVNPGLTTAQVLSLSVALPTERRMTPAEERATDNPGQILASEREAALNTLIDRLEALPGVEGAGLADDIIRSNAADEAITIPGRPDVPMGQLSTGSVTPGLLEALDVPVRRGRHLTRRDAAAKIRALWAPLASRQLSVDQQSRVALAEPVVVNESFVRRFFADENPIGRRFCVDPTGRPYWYEIVGVVADMHRQSLERQPVPEYFQTFLPRSNAELLVRTRADPLSVAPTVRRLLAESLPGSIVLDVTTLDRRMGGLTAQRRFQAALLAGFALLAIVLAAIGIYGVVHYAVAERWRELGIRSALGATPRDVVGDVIRRGMVFPVIGLVAGFAGATAMSRVLAGLLFGIARGDPVTLVGTASVLCAVAFLACYLPARRASRVDPMIAIRSEH